MTPKEIALLYNLKIYIQNYYEIIIFKRVVVCLELKLFHFKQRFNLANRRGTPPPPPTRKKKTKKEKRKKKTVKRKWTRRNFDIPKCPSYCIVSGQNLEKWPDSTSPNADVPRYEWSKLEGTGQAGHTHLSLSLSLPRRRCLCLLR
jgi:hypothetical protein